jgi:hypothetical protein
MMGPNNYQEPKRSRRYPILIVALLLFPSLVSSAPIVKQFFPSRTILLGQSLFWIIELRYPVWESYRLQIQPCEGAEIDIADEKLEEINGRMRAIYRLRVVPANLIVQQIPTVLISDPKGQSIAISGKAIHVKSITGKSTEIKDPLTQSFRIANTNGVLADFLLFLAVSALMILLLRKFFYVKTPRQIVLRQFEEIYMRFRREQQIDIPVLSSLLRSDLLWNGSVQAMSGAELKELTKQNAELNQIAGTLETLELVRFSNEQVRWDWRNIKKSIETAMDLLQNKTRKRRQG